MSNKDRDIGNIGDKNLLCLQALKNVILEKRRATLVDRLAKKIDDSYDAFLINQGDDGYKTTYQILIAERHSPSEVTDPEYFKRCAQALINRGLYGEDENGNLTFIDDWEIENK